MSNHFAGAPDSRGQNASLAQWLYRLLAAGAQTIDAEPLPVGEDTSLPGATYHADFYPQIPDFALALLRQDSQATTRHAPLFFHLIGCPTCRRAYLETYDALATALADEIRPAQTSLSTSSSANLATTSPKLLVFVCQLLVGEAKTVLRQAHREHSDRDAWARALLQQAMQISRYIMQATMRQRALRDLVEVASLYSTTTADAPPGQVALSYSALVGAGNGTRGRRVRRAEVMSRPGAAQASIDLQAGSLEGRITQEGEMLILKLVDLDAQLQGKPLLISVPLGTLLEPIRWLGGNPYAIRSAGPVGSDGTLVTPLGRTDLLLSNPEERNLLETLFKKLDVRPATD
ncbi:MAG TPA: hypothetical protein VFV38_38700 [Ktedonobacteraceae bacterium]|nr:hypothetical protein [Ktedonobacteraceae bacterium]